VRFARDDHSRDEPLAKHTTLRVGGPADVYVEPAMEEDLAARREILRRKRKCRFSFSVAARICWCAMAVFAAWSFASRTPVSAKLN
jgi:hypothetical protein